MWRWRMDNLSYMCRPLHSISPSFFYHSSDGTWSVHRFICYIYIYIFIYSFLTRKKFKRGLRVKTKSEHNICLDVSTINIFEGVSVLWRAGKAQSCCCYIHAWFQCAKKIAIAKGKSTWNQNEKRKNKEAKVSVVCTVCLLMVNREEKKTDESESYCTSNEAHKSISSTKECNCAYTSFFSGGSILPAGSGQKRCFS